MPEEEARTSQCYCRRRRHSQRPIRSRGKFLVGKYRSLGEVSILGQNISLYVLNLVDLLGQLDRNLIFPTQIAFNRRLFSIQSLIDIGANRLIFVNIRLVRLLIKNYRLRTIRLSKVCLVNRFDGKLVELITYAVALLITIDSRTQHQVPMLITDLSYYNIIIGRIQFEKHGVLLDCQGYRIIQPKEPTLFESVASKIPVPIPQKILKRETQPEAKYQKDTDRRDQLFIKELSREQIRKPRQDPRIVELTKIYRSIQELLVLRSDPKPY